MTGAINQQDQNDPFVTSDKKGLGYLVISNTDRENVKMDIWFVHGLFGNRTTTWTHGNGTFWPKLLADEFPLARVIVYGYDANVAKFSRLWEGVDSSGLESYGIDLAYAVRNSRQAITGENATIALNVPIYFIGHSLGGLVIEQALLSSLGTDESLHPVSAQTSGILFMGTPHSGSHLATWARLLRAAFTVLVPVWANNTNKKVLEVLEKKSDVCKRVHKDFLIQGKRGRLSHLKIFCFYETVAMSGIKVVPEESAVLAPELSAPITATHRDIVKFQDKEDPGYLKVASQLREWIAEDLAALDAAKPSGEDDDGEEENAGTKPKKGGGVHVIGGRVEHMYGGTPDMRAIGVAGNMKLFDQRNNQGRFIGNMKIKNFGRGAKNQWGNSDQWGSSSSEDEEEEKDNPAGQGLPPA